MSQELQDHAEQLAQYEAERYEREELENLIDYYTPLRPATVSQSVAAVASANTATSKEQ